MDRFLISSNNTNNTAETVEKHSKRLVEVEVTESDSDSNEGRKLKRAKKNIYRQKFKSEWVNKENELWLIEHKEEAKCKVCNKIIQGGITHIKRHAGSKTHNMKIRSITKTAQIENVLLDQKKIKLREGIKKGELKMVMAIAEHNLPFAFMDHLPRLMESVCYDSEVIKNIKCGRKKATAICKNIIAPEALNLVCEGMRENWYSLIIDETTDVSTVQCLAIVARYNVHDQIRDKFLGLTQVQQATAEGLYTSVVELLNKNKVPLKKMIGFAADNCNVMQGNKNGVQKRFRDAVPDIYIQGCVCHSLALISSAACSELPRSVESLARDIVSYFSHSSKKSVELKEFQEFVALQPHKLLKLSQTRWLSLQAVVNRILEQWPALILFFTSEVHNKVKGHFDPQAILVALNDTTFKLFFNFLSYILEIVNLINMEFQSEEPKLYCLHKRISGLFKTVLKNFLKQEYLDKVPLPNINYDPQNLKPLESIYLGANVQKILLETTVTETELKNVRLYCLKFYIKLCQQIQNRFQFNDPVLLFMENFEPKVAISGKCESLVAIANRFPKLVLNKNLERLDFEWRLLSEVPELKDNIDNISFYEFWKKVYNIKNGVEQLMFQNLSYLLKGLFCIPHSSACAERIFSSLNLIKTKNRNRLLPQTCNALLLTKGVLENTKCFNYEPTNSMLRRNCTETEDLLETEAEEATF